MSQTEMECAITCIAAKERKEKLAETKLLANEKPLILIESKNS